MQLSVTYQIIFVLQIRKFYVWPVTLHNFIQNIKLQTVTIQLNSLMFLYSPFYKTIQVCHRERNIV